MASTSAKFGFRPAFHPSGCIRSEPFTIASGYATSIFKGDPVKLVAAGVVNAAAVGDELLGIFAGCEYTDSSGKPTVSTYWPTGTSATNIVAYVWTDPRIVYEAELTNASAPTTAATIVGATLAWTAGTGSTATGLSGDYLASGDAGADTPFRILRKAGRPGDEWTDSYIVVQAVINESHLDSTTATI